ncbi:hypothetical protein [Salinibacterium sp.]|uniref:hypothetical protein n=1 Tax=Salinibacterium sp. TaxID=1915057 RepID=UPI00286AC87E|nr:hypothetical protein [Salinibacterium sp.]
MRRFIFNTTLLSAIVGGWGTVQSTRKGPRDWRLVLMWISWGATVAIAVGTIVEQSRNDNELED